MLWGDYYATKDKGKFRVKQGAAAKGRAPLFVAAVLKSVWDFYGALCAVPRDKDRITKVAGGLNIKVSMRDMQSGDQKAVLRSLVAQWMPLHRAVLEADDRVNGRVPRRDHRGKSELRADTQHVAAARGRQRPAERRKEVRMPAQ